jgi:hypothetical protein
MGFAGNCRIGVLFMKENTNAKLNMCKRTKTTIFKEITFLCIEI